MIKYDFRNDYSEGVHPNIIQALAKTNLIQETGYGEDSFCSEAAGLIRKEIKKPDADVHFVSGGTQANLIVISSILKPYESVVAADSGHIFTHETGAIEATGHKINNILTKDGKITPEMIQPVLDFHSDEHMVKPAMVYISNSTELGTVYSKQELKRLSAFCKQNNLYLFMDGARLGSALTSQGKDLSLADIAALVDVFYIGGTKNGALIGESIVIINEKLKENFRFYIKQRGALLAKGRIFGIQFIELFSNNLFYELATHANAMAHKLAEGIKKAGYGFITEPVSNQIFPILPDKLIESLSAKYGFYVWAKHDEKSSSIRLVCSWATKDEFVDEFIDDLLN
jgi:threonine aldolase